MAPRVLLSSVFKPFGVDSMYARNESNIELFHNQITKVQGVFSIRTIADTMGIHVIANNIEVPTTVLDCPTLERFCKEVKKGYDFIGIGANLANFQKLKKMVEEARELSPKSTIVVGGFCANAPDLEKVMDVDYVCVGEGISFMRGLLGLPEEFKFKNPDVFAETREIFGVPLYGFKSPHIIVGLGCSYGCDFCSPSHFFGRRHIKFFNTGGEIYEEMLRIERNFSSLALTFLGDDNFFLDLERAEELRHLVIEGGKIWKIFVFGSADRVAEYGAEKIAEMGVNTLWIGRESNLANYKKNRGINLAALIAELRSYGIKVILSGIVLLDQHTKENIQEDINDHIGCRPDFSQFCLYSPAPGTPLYDRMVEEGRILTGIPYEEWHGMKQHWFHHPEFTLKEGEHIHEQAFQQEFHELGPSLMRYIETDYEGWKNLKDSPKPHLRARADFFAGEMKKYKILLLAMEYLAPTDKMQDKIRAVRQRVENSFGPANAFQKAAAAGLFMTGRFREFRTRHWGDTIQPKTKVSLYNQ